MESTKAIQILKDILRIDTTLSNEKENADYLEKLFQEHGIKTEQVEYSKGRNQLIATLEGDRPGKTLGFTGHMDVVPVGEIPWKHDPFGAEEEDGKIYARGATDMKGGLAALVVAMIELKERKVSFPGKIKLIVTVGEEQSAIGAEQLVQMGYGDDLDGLVIGEPTENGLFIAHKGAVWFRLTSYGKTAHGSMPEAGVNAVENMLAVLNQFQQTQELGKHKDEFVGASTYSIDVLHGGNGTNVIPDKCVCEIDIRTIAGQSHDEIIQHMNTIIEGLKKEKPNLDVQVEVINNLESIRSQPDEELVLRAVEAIKKVTGKEVVPGGMTGYTDGSMFVKSKKSYPIMILGPGTMSKAHQPEEYVEIKNYLDSIKIYEELAETFLK